MSQQLRNQIFKIADAIRKLETPPNTTMAGSTGQPKPPINQPPPLPTLPPLPPLQK